MSPVLLFPVFLAAAPFVACLWVHYTPTPATEHAFTTRDQTELNRRLEVEGL